MVMTLEKRVAIYARVSSDNQRERETILTQKAELQRRLKTDSSSSAIAEYCDDGYTGVLPLNQRPDGARLLQDARQGLFQELWVYKLDRLARDEIEALTLRREFNRLGVKIYAVSENIEGELEYGLRALFAGEERRTFLLRSAAGMNRAAHEGRYTGGIVPIGYKVVGLKQNAHLVPSDEILWSNFTEADVVRKIYNRLAVDGWSCVRIAKEFNSLGIPTDYVHDNRQVLIKGQRKELTQGIWRAGRIRSIVVNPIYKGEPRYGQRSNKPGREVITAKVRPWSRRKFGRLLKKP